MTFEETQNHWMMGVEQEMPREWKCLHGRAQHSWTADTTQLLP